MRQWIRWMMVVILLGSTQQGAAKEKKQAPLNGARESRYYLLKKDKSPFHLLNRNTIGDAYLLDAPPVRYYFPPKKPGK